MFWISLFVWGIEISTYNCNHFSHHCQKACLFIRASFWWLLVISSQFIFFMLLVCLFYMVMPSCQILNILLWIHMPLNHVWISSAQLIGFSFNILLYKFSIWSDFQVLMNLWNPFWRMRTGEHEIIVHSTILPLRRYANNCARNVLGLMFLT
jgi:hypothetical protein